VVDAYISYMYRCPKVPIINEISYVVLIAISAYVT